jgi:hypothetical protein
MTFFGFCFRMLIVKHRTWLMNSRRNRGQFRFLLSACLAIPKGSVGLLLAKASNIRISIPLDLFSRSFKPVLWFIRSRRQTPLLAPSLVFIPQRSAEHAGVFFYTFVLSGENKIRHSIKSMQSKTWYEDFVWVLLLIDLIVGFLVLIIKAFDNQLQKKKKDNCFFNSCSPHIYE